jgi:hypothetical protein
MTIQIDIKHKILSTTYVKIILYAGICLQHLMQVHCEITPNF